MVVRVLRCVAWVLEGHDWGRSVGRQLLVVVWEGRWVEGRRVQNGQEMERTLVGSASCTQGRSLARAQEDMGCAKHS